MLKQELEFAKRKLVIEVCLKEDLIKTNEQEKIYFKDQIISRDNKIMQYEKEIKQQCKNKNRQEINPNDSLLNYHRKSKAFKDTGTQTHEENLSLYNNNNNNYILKELADMRIRQKQMDDSIKSLQSQVSQQKKNKYTHHMAFMYSEKPHLPTQSHLVLE